jgi:hypothetical protein
MSPNPPTPFPDTLDALADYVKSQNVHLFVAVPCYGCKLSARFAMSLINFEGFCLRKGIQMTLDLLGNESLITRGRCILAERALKSKATHLLFLDADIGFEVHTILRLVAFDADVCCGIYARKGLDFNAIVKSEDTSVAALMDAGLGFNINFPPGKSDHSVTNGFVEVYDAATGCMLIKRQTLETLKSIYSESHLVKNDIPSSRDVVPEYVALFETEICPDTRRFLSEDYAFCRKVQKANMSVWVDITAPLSHTGTFLYTGSALKRCKMQYEKA